MVYLIKPIEDIHPEDITKMREQAYKASVRALCLLPIHFKVPFRVEHALDRAYREGNITKPVNELTNNELLNIRQIGPMALIAIRQALENRQ